MKQSAKNPIPLLSVCIVCLFLTGFLLLVAFGAKSYRDVVDSQYGNMDTRALMSYIPASVKANDSCGAVSMEDSVYGQVLIATDQETGFALRYYLYDGRLVEDFARAGTPLVPEDAQGIAASDVFSVKRLDNGLLEVITDAGRTLLHPRCGEENVP